MRNEIKNTVANMTVAEMRKTASQYGIKSASKYKRTELEEMLVDAMVKVAKETKKAEKTTKRGKADKVEDEAATMLASELVEHLKTTGIAKEELLAQNRKVLIQVMKALHCKKWYRTYDKNTMVEKIMDATVA